MFTLKSREYHAYFGLIARLNTPFVAPADLRLIRLKTRLARVRISLTYLCFWDYHVDFARCHHEG